MKNGFLFLIFLVASSLFGQKQEVQLLIESASEIKRDNYFSADSMLQVAQQLSIDLKEDGLLAEVYYERGKIAASNGFYEEADAYLSNGILLAKKLKDTTLECQTTKILSDNYLDWGNLEMAVKTSNNAIELAKALKNDRLISDTYAGLAEIYRNFDIHELSLKFNLKALNYAIKSNDENAIGKAYNNLSVVYGEMGDEPRLIDSLTSGMRFLSEDNYFARAKFNSNIGRSHRILGNYETAIKFNRKALAFKLKAKMHSSISFTYGEIGRCYAQLNQFDSAIYYVEKEKEITRKFKNVHRIRDAYSHLSEVYELAGDYKSALKYTDLSNYYEDSIYEADVEKQVILFQRKYDLSKKEQEVSDLKNSQLLLQAKQRNLIIVLFALGIFSVLLIILSRYRSSKNEQKRKVIELKLKAKEVEEVRNEQELESFTKDLVAKNKAIRSLNEQIALKEQEINEFRNSKTQELKELNDIRILTDEDWKRFKILFEKVHPGFFNRLNSLDFSFTKGEKRLLALARLDMDNQQIADALGISSESVSKSKFRLKKKILDSKFQSVEELAHSI